MSHAGLSMYTHRVVLTPFVKEIGLFSQPLLDPNKQKTLRARVKKVNKRIRRPGGEEVLVSSEAMIHCPSYVITERDKIELPDGTTPAIISVESEPDMRGRTHSYKVLFGNSRRTG